MLKHTLLPLYFLLFCVFQTNAQCPPDEVPVRLEIKPGENWSDFYFVFTEPTLNEFFADGAFSGPDLQVLDFCLPDVGCTIFYLLNELGEGMPDGFYRLYVRDTLVKENLAPTFSKFETVRFGCPPGSFCDNPFEMQLGAATSATGGETWYRFVPQDTGTYKISTCDPANVCPSKIWVYDFCEGLFVTDNQAGAVFYSDHGCANGAEATVFLAGGKEYYIRTKYRYEDCFDNPLTCSMTYVGPVIGCRDTAACNYNPLATVTDTCIYEGVACLRLPDLQTDEGLLRSSMSFETYFNGDQCAVEEGCIRGFGNRYLLRFDTRISNVGDEDYYIGETPLNPTTPSDQFIYDLCHQHWHYRGYADYILYDAAGKRSNVGSKNGFCVLDLECNTGGFGKYTCENMGITKDCGDVYDKFLDCQWVDITDLPAGSYTLVCRVNWEKKPDANGRLEKDYLNNWAQACFNLTYDGNVPDVEFVNQCPQFTDCAGILFGNTPVDCEGNCNGKLLRGDWNRDTIRNDADLDAYIDVALADNGAPTECNDLDANGQIDVYDAALLQECTIHENDPQHWGSRFPCTFPGGLDNPNDHVFLRAGALDTVAKTFTIRIVNPNNKLLGYEFEVSGLEIESVQNSVANYNAEIKFDNSGEIIALAADESTIKKNSTVADLMKIKYKKLTDKEVCIKKITAVVNERYQRSNAEIGPTACTTNPTYVSTQEPENQAFAVHVQPNPFTQSADVFFENPDNDLMEISCTDLTGRIVKKFNGIRGNQVSFDGAGLPNGIYLITVCGTHGCVTEKVALQR